MPTAPELFDAIRQGDLARVQSLIDADRALISAKNESGVSAVLSSVYFGRKDIRDLLFGSGSKTRTAGRRRAGQVGSR